jgi:membrane protein DedA with SNARE-associated domain
MPFGRFATICALLALPWTLALMSLGHVAARALPDMPWAPVAVALLLILLPRAVRRFGKRSP